MKIVFILTLLAICPLFSHQDFLLYSSYEKICYQIQTSFRHEEQVKLEMIAKLVNQLANELNYNDSIYINYTHHYLQNYNPDYGLSFNRGDAYFDEDKKDSVFLFQKKVLVITVHAYTIVPLHILKLADYGMNNIDEIDSGQTLSYTSKWLINYKYFSIPLSKIQSILMQDETGIVKKIDSQKNKIEHNEFPNEYFDDRSIYYFYQSGEYHLCERKHIYTNEGYMDKDSLLLSLPNIYQFEMLSIGMCMVFDTDSSFYFVYTHLGILSSKNNLHFVSENESNWFYKKLPKSIEYLDGNLISIYLGSYQASSPNKNPWERETYHRHAIYDFRKNILIQNLEEEIFKE